MITGKATTAELPRTRSRILSLPTSGRLLVCTDLHGNLRDFQRIRGIFRRARRQGPCQLLFTGDLIHGPNFSRAAWPEYMGSYYTDRSGAVVDGLLRLKREFSGEVHSLLGNHEHSHVGGPHTPKFWADETAHFEATVGPRRARIYNAAFAQFPLIAIAPAGIVVTHAAPNAPISSAIDIARLSYRRGAHQPALIDQMSSPLMQLLWARACPPPVARQFLAALGTDAAAPLSLVVFGHEVVPTGFSRIGKEQLQLSTSFGLKDENKYYLDIDLSRCYGSVSSLRHGRELKRLYAE